MRFAMRTPDPSRHAGRGHGRSNLQPAAGGAQGNPDGVQGLGGRPEGEGAGALGTGRGVPDAQRRQGGGGKHGRQDQTQRAARAFGDGLFRAATRLRPHRHMGQGCRCHCKAERQPEAQQHMAAVAVTGVDKVGRLVLYVVEIEHSVSSSHGRGMGRSLVRSRSGADQLPVAPASVTISFIADCR